MGTVDGYVQVDPGGGKKADTSELTVSSQTVERERANLSDPVANMHSKVGDFVESLDYGLLLRGIYGKALADAFWQLADEVHKLRLILEEEDSSI